MLAVGERQTFRGRAQVYLAH